MKKLVRNLATEENRAFWKRVEQAAVEVRSWPDWKRAGINVNQTRLEVRSSPELTICEHCGTANGSATPCRTAYSWSPVLQPQTWVDRLLLQDSLDPKEALVNPEPNPNQDPILCPECTQAYHESWDETWAEYYNELGGG